jgi:WD40 repeat protein/serine/threonine protein kinase/tetratricopeptide (TPR) repeat protein
LIEHELFAAALEIDDPGERAAFLDRACGGELELRARIEALLRAHEQAGSFLAAPTNAGAATLDVPQPLEGPGTVIGPYKLLQTIGEGGMGTVYMAEQIRPVRRLVALKVIKAGMDTRSVLARFGAERQALALMDHPNIAKVLDAGATETGRPYFVMELVKGVPITRYCDDRRLSLRERLELFVPVCQAVQHAHQKGIIHRDLKPSNILIAQYDGRPAPKVIDFGVAKATGQRLTEQTLYTEFGAVVGTLEYMSPEQAELNQLDIDTRSDVYSLGAILYELLTGSTPLGRERLKAAAFVEMLRIIREEDSPRPSERLSTTEELPSIAACRQVEPRRLSALLRGELDWIVMKALEKDRKRRYETANSLAADLLRYLDDEPVQACPPSTWYRFRKFARRNRAVLATASVVAAALVAVAVISVMYAAGQAQANLEISGLAGRLQTSLAGSNRLLAIRNFDRGQAAFEKEQIGPGLLWMIESWRSAIAAGDPAWQHAAKANLSAWQLHHPRLKAVLSHPSPVDSAAFSPDGKLVVTCSDDRTAQLWDAATARPFGQPLRHEREVMRVAFSPDGKTILTGSQDKTARLWETASGRPIGPTLLHPDQVFAVAFSPDAKILLTGCNDGIIRLWDAATGRAIGSTLSNQDPVDTLAFGPDGKTVLSGVGDGGARLWDAATLRPIGPPLGRGLQLRSVALSPDGKTVLTGSQDSTVQLWDANSGQPIGGNEKQHSERVRAVAFSPDGKLFVTGSTDKTARLWDAATRQPIGPPLQHQGPVVAVAFSPDGKTFLTASSDCTVRLWDADPGQLVGLILGGESHGKAAFTPDGKSFLNVSGDRLPRLRDAATGLPIGPPPRLPPFSRAVALSPDGKMLLTGSGRSDAHRWDAATGRPIGQPLPHPGGAVSIAFSPDSKTIITGGGDHTARLWDATTGEPLAKPVPQPGSVEAVAFSPDGKAFLTAYDIGSVQLWDLATVAPLGEPFPHPGCVSAAEFSPDGKILATGCEDSMARLWDVESRTLRVPPLRHQGWVFDVAFSPDGKTLLTSSKDHAAQLWDVATGMSLGPQFRLASWTWSTTLGGVAFNPDGKSFLISDGEHTRRFRTATELPDDLERVATWVEVLTGMALDPQQGAIQVLDNAAWLEHSGKLMQLGGPPDTGSAERLDPIVFGQDPTARARAWMQRKQWDAAEAEFDEVVRARPYDVSGWLGRSELHTARSQFENAATDLAGAVLLQPDNPQFRYFHILSLLSQGDRAGLQPAYSDLLSRYGSVTNPSTANTVAWSCALVPHVVADRMTPVRLAEAALAAFPPAQKPDVMNTLGATLYRAGRYEEAISRLLEGIRLRGDEGSPQDWAFIALAQYYLGQDFKARPWLERLRTYRPNESPGRSWDELEIRLLRREAEAVILYDPMFPIDPFAH